jgi:hypothetical protein
MGYYDKFVAGFASGAGILTTELTIFFGDLIFNAVTKALPSTPSTDSVTSIYTSSILAIVIIGLVINIFIGYCFSTTFALGYIAGDIFVLILFAKYLWSIAPAVVTSMVIVPLFVLLGMYLKGKYAPDNYQYDYGYQIKTFKIF